MAWLLFIFLLPLPGFIVFLVLGGRYLPRSRRNRHSAVKAKLHNLVEQWERSNSPLAPEQRDLELSNVVAVGRTLGAFPMLGGNSASLYADYQESIAEMAKAILRAQKFVHLEFYIMVHDQTTAPVFEALKRVRSRGVEVRVLIDYISAVRNPGMLRTRRSLEEMGAQLRYCLPVRPWRGEYQRPDLRNHRKLLVIDGTVGFMGSQNLIDASYNKLSNRRRGLSWKDLNMCFAGPAVLALEAVFAADWHAETGEMLDSFARVDPLVIKDSMLEMQLIPSGPGYAHENNLQVFVALMYTAKKRIWITSPYLIPERSLMVAIKSAVARGVEVIVFVSEVGDQPVVYHAQRSYYEELLESGVRIFMYRPPYILHAKHFTVDDKVAVIGSSNMDERSFNLNFEISMLVHDLDFVKKLDEINLQSMRQSRELTLKQWQERSVFSRLINNLARLTSSLQ